MTQQIRGVQRLILIVWNVQTRAFQQLQTNQVSRIFAINATSSHKLRSETIRETGFLCSSKQLRFVLHCRFLRDSREGPTSSLHNYARPTNAACWRTTCLVIMMWCICGKGFNWLVMGKSPAPPPPPPSQTGQSSLYHHHLENRLLMCVRFHFCNHCA
jgi:hypothetical protein